MKVIVDYQAFLMQKYGGVSKYHALIDRYINTENSSTESKIWHIGCDNIYLDTRSIVPQFLYQLRGYKRLLNKINQQLVLSKMNDYDVLHPSYYDPYILKSKRRPNYVLTVHDLISEKYFPKGREVQSANKRLMIQNASAIIAISHATKADLIEFYKIAPEKISVIWHGYPKEFDQSLDKSELLEQPYILFTGQRKEYKNFNQLLRAMHKIRLNFDIELKVIGAPASMLEKAILQELNIEDCVTFHQSVSEEGLYRLYRNASCFVFPSLCEGFGMPILEAFITKCPVVCSDIAVFREVGGKAATYFDPLSYLSIADQVIKVLSNTSTLEDQVNQAYLRAQEFSWEKSAKATKNVYKTVC